MTNKNLNEEVCEVKSMLALGISIAALIISIVNTAFIISSVDIYRIAKRNKKRYEQIREYNEYLEKELDKLYENYMK